MQFLVIVLSSCLKGEKHVKIMFDKINSMPQLKVAEFYTRVKPCTEVGGEDVQQTTLEGGGWEELQSLHADGHPTLNPCTTIGDYTLSCHETLTPIEVCGSNYQQDCIQSLRRGGEDKADVDHGKDEYEEMIGRDDFHDTTPYMDDDVTLTPLSCLRDRRTRNDHSIFEYGLHVPPSNFFSNLPLASILCNSRSVLTCSGCSCFRPNFRRTRSSRWNSTSQKHISGIFDLHILLPSM